MSKSTHEFVYIPQILPDQLYEDYLIWIPAD